MYANRRGAVKAFRDKLRKYADLERSLKTLQTPYGTVRRKDSAGYGASRGKYEYDDISRIAIQKNISLEEAVALVDRR